MQLRSKKARVNLEYLEARMVPAFSATFNPTASAWYLTQQSDQGAVTISVDGANQLTITEQLGGAATLGTAGASLQIIMLSTTDDLTVDLDTGLAGWLNVNLGNQDRTLSLTGDDNSIGGNLTITAGSGAQRADLAVNNDLTVGGSANINLGLGSDTVFLGDPLNFILDRGATIGTDLTLTGVNIVEHTGTLVVGRHVSWTNSSETQSNLYRAEVIVVNASDLGTAIIGGNFTYRGGSTEDSLFFDDPTLADMGVIIGGAMFVDLGANFDTFFVQEVRLEDATIGGNLTVVAGMNPFTTDRVITDEDSTIGGNIVINLGEGAGGGIASEVILLGTFGGQGITFTGGTGNDSFGFGMVGNPASVRAKLGLGTDTFTLNGADLTTLPPATASLSLLDIDFGAGSDVFDNRWGASAFPFTVFLRNLP